MVLTSVQAKLLANFLVDIAKGLFLGIFASQALFSGSILLRVIYLLSTLSTTLLFLFFALKFAQYSKDYE